MAGATCSGQLWIGRKREPKLPLGGSAAHEVASMGFCGFAFAWLGHFGFEKNKPASFKRPLYSFMGDWAMYKDIWMGKVRL